MVVLDQQHVLELVEDLAKVAGALTGQAGAEGVLPARRQNEGAGTGGKRLLECLRLRSVVVDGDRDRNESERPEQVEDADEARVFDCDSVAGCELGSERALDSVECAGNDRQRRRRDAVGGEVSLSERDEPVELVRERVSAGTWIEASQRRGQRGEKLRVRVAGRQVAYAG